MKLRIVLVEPREAGNIGAAARAMKNFGQRDLVLVGSLPVLAPVAGWWASGAEDVIEGAARFETLAEAVGDCHLTLATTSLRGRSLAPDLSPASAAEEAAKLSDGERVAVVFGREDRGLTREETLLCHRSAVIPTSRDFPTMNLAQSVSLFCYAFTVAGEKKTEVRRVEEAASAAAIERLHERAQALLVECGFLHLDDSPDRIYAELRQLSGKLALSSREVTLLLGMLRQIEWRIGQG